jgi:hypothetical protein
MLTNYFLPLSINICDKRCVGNLRRSHYGDVFVSDARVNDCKASPRWKTFVLFNITR